MLKPLKRVARACRRFRLRKRCVIGSGSDIEKVNLVQNIRDDRDAVKVGANSVVRGRLLTYAHGGSIEIGDYCYVGARTEIWSMNQIRIGDRVLIAHDVNIHDGTAHSLDSVERHQHFKAILEQGHPRESLPGVFSDPVIIEDDVWISFGVTILKGVRIGKGSVVAARSIVTSDILPNTIYRCQVTPVTRELTGTRTKHPTTPAS